MIFLLTFIKVFGMLLVMSYQNILTILVKLLFVIK